MLSILNVISSTHNCCEDSVFTKETEDIIYGGVFDGCSRGIKSHWASQTLAYAFAMNNDITSNKTAHNVYSHLWSLMRTLHLQITNFESTCLIFKFDKRNKQLHIRVFGDGFYFVNGVKYEIDQNNVPDYFGHYIGNVYSFYTYLEKYPAKTYFDVTDFKVCSDGIKSINISQFVDQDGTDPLSILLGRPTSNNYLERMWNKLKQKHFTLSDDLTIVSYVQD